MGATDIEDRKGFTRRKNHDSADWSFSSGAHQGIAEAAPAKRSPICSGPNGIELVDVDVVRFLRACEAGGAEVINCAPRGWERLDPLADIGIWICAHVPGLHERVRTCS